MVMHNTMTDQVPTNYKSPEFRKEEIMTDYTASM